MSGYVVRGCWAGEIDNLCYATEAGFANVGAAMSGYRPGKLLQFSSERKANRFIKEWEENPGQIERVAVLDLEVVPATPEVLELFSLDEGKEKSKDWRKRIGTAAGRSGGRLEPGD